ncbi:MAG: winged helix-turn-helix domain-containing protein [Pseudomonadota bacterium]
MAEPDPHPEPNTGGPVLRLRLVWPGRGMLGPGKADLLALIDETGSISAAGRAMGMSYKRAWTLVSTLNDMFAEPLVDRARGGTQGGGAALTKTGREVLAHYRALEESSVSAGAEPIAALEALIKPQDPTEGG